MEKMDVQNTLFSSFENELSNKQLILPKSKVLIAVSGGVDSKVLLHLFETLAPAWALQLAVGHVHHGIRGNEADRDAARVQEYCQKRNLDFYRIDRNVPDFCRKKKLGLEEGARIIRYRALQQLANRVGASVVALAHHADDQAETVLMNFLRGTGMRGLSGMQAHRGIFIRPLLAFSKSELLNYAQAQELGYFHDSSNTDLSLRRNRIRHELIPLLTEHYNPAIVSRLNQLASTMNESETFLRHEAQRMLSACIKEQDENKIILDIVPYLTYFKILKKYILCSAIALLTGHFKMLSSQEWQKFFRMLKKRSSSKALRVFKTISVRISPSEIIITPADKQKSRQIAISLKSGKVELWGGYLLEINPCQHPLEQIINNKDQNCCYIDADRIAEPLFVRTVKSGDVFQPLGLQGKKKVADYFIDSKIPHSRRSQIPILVCQTGIVWICGYRMDDRFKVLPSSNNIRVIKFRHAE
jgi:tRNA(Ile)-lysidine synthase